MPSDKKYTVLSFNIGNYEQPREVKHPSPDAEYIYVTDNPDVTSDTWNVIHIENLHPEDNFSTCWQIRYNPFKYASTDTVIKVDGSMQVVGNTDELIDYFNQKGDEFDIGLCIHPYNNIMAKEYDLWCATRGYSRKQADKVLAFMTEKGYDTNAYKGLYQYNFMIQRNNAVNNEINTTTLEALHLLADEGKLVDRLDQTIGSFFLNKYFSDRIRVMALDQRIAFSKYFRWHKHGTNRKYYFAGGMIEPWLFNQPAKMADIDYGINIRKELIMNRIMVKLGNMRKKLARILSR